MPAAWIAIILVCFPADNSCREYRFHAPYKTHSRCEFALKEKSSGMTALLQDIGADFTLEPRCAPVGQTNG